MHLPYNSPMWDLNTNEVHNHIPCDWLTNLFKINATGYKSYHEGYKSLYIHLKHVRFVMSGVITFIRHLAYFQLVWTSSDCQVVLCNVPTWFIDLVFLLHASSFIIYIFQYFCSTKGNVIYKHHSEFAKICSKTKIFKMLRPFVGCKKINKKTLEYPKFG